MQAGRWRYGLPLPHLYLDARVDEETLKKVVFVSVATALANIVFPVPGGPNMSTPCSAQDGRRPAGATHAWDCHADRMCTERKL